MAKRAAKKRDIDEVSVEDYRHSGATRKNIPPAKIAAEGKVPEVPKIQYSYSPRRPPELLFDTSHGSNGQVSRKRRRKASQSILSLSTSTSESRLRQF